jgi:hypothetical protein
MKRMYLCLASLLAVLANANAESGGITILRNPPVAKFTQSARMAYSDCLLLSLAYWGEMSLRKYGKGDPDGKYQEVLQCVDRGRDKPRDDLLAAIKYLDGRPAGAKALKDYYLKWSSQMGSLVPETRESSAQHAVRQRKADDLLQESLSALELELALGT